MVRSASMGEGMTYQRSDKGTNLTDVQEMNRTLVIKLIRRMQVCSRAELAKATGLSQPTITNIVNHLMELGLVKEIGSREGGRGRRSIGLTLVSQACRVIGVRLTRNYVSAGLFDLDGTQSASAKFDIDSKDGVFGALDVMKRIVADMLAHPAARHSSATAIGVAVPGPLLYDRNRIAVMTDFPGWDRISIRDQLRKTFGMEVYVEHDAKAGALAEWWFGSHPKVTGTLLYVSVAQGVGAGLVIDGNIYKGAQGIAGEIGHMSIDYNGPRCECGNKGCLELYCSLSAIRKRLQSEITPGALWRAYEQGEPEVVAEFEHAAGLLGFGLAGAVNAFNPECIVIGDELTRAGQPILHHVKEGLRKHLLPEVYKPLSVVLSSFQEADAILIGASTLAIDHVLQSPLSFFNQ